MSDGERFLRYATFLYAVGLVAHLADHYRRGGNVISRQVALAGTISSVVSVIFIFLVFMRYRRSPIFAIILGFPVALGVSAVHLLPHWSAFSDSFVGGRARGVTALSWTVVLIEIVGALAVGLAGARIALKPKTVEAGR